MTAALPADPIALRIVDPCPRCAGLGRTADEFGNPFGARCTRCRGACEVPTREAANHVALMAIERPNPRAGRLA